MASELASTHRRYNPLLDEWVLVSPQRLARPWQGQVEPEQPVETRHYDASCYLCPGNRRASGRTNPRYDATFAFDNDFPALEPTSAAKAAEGDLFRSAPERGVCRVVCYSPRHDVTLARMPAPDVRAVIDTLADESQSLAARADVAYVQVFENKGLAMGCSNPHPHAQIWATEHVPTLPARKRNTQRAYRDSHDADLLGDYVRAELADGRRVIWSDERWSVVVPFWAVWPYQTMLIPSRRVGTLAECDGDERDSLALALGQISSRYDSVFATDTPYSMCWFQAPTAARDDSWRLHIEIFPPLLRSATVRKFLVGYELAAEPQRDLTPEVAAVRLREQHVSPSS
ncbi:MAG TPA: UDP-glucose--hexose-1-phosphate uridylyltransferase [Gemmatimonadaceae bacterium]|nr:UDP-glucose--hexose-1-phosphate uridylyltransferase [Gemmatimonadaceae bacterium]